MSELKIFYEFFHKLHTYRKITLNNDKVNEALDLIDAWSFAHNGCNGMESEEQIKENLTNIVKKMQEL